MASKSSIGKGDAFFVREIVNACKSIESYIDSRSKKNFMGNPMVKDAVRMMVLTIGEAANSLSQKFRDSIPVLPWKNIIGMRNILMHQYWQTDYEIVWEVASEKAPFLRKMLEHDPILSSPQ